MGAPKPSEQRPLLWVTISHLYSTPPILATCRQSISRIDLFSVNDVLFSVVVPSASECCRISQSDRQEISQIFTTTGRPVALDNTDGQELGAKWDHTGSRSTLGRRRR
jgi:hypothetical protein